MTSPSDINDSIEKSVFNSVPMSIAVIDPDMNVVVANEAFERKHGAWQNKKCYELKKNLDSVCPNCDAAATFADGEIREREKTGRDENGRQICYVEHMAPIKEPDGTIRYLIETTTEISDTEFLRREYGTLFEHVPCDLLIIDKNFQIVETNQRSREKFGAIEGAYCYEVLKNRSNQCHDCTAKHTFEDGMIHSGRSTVINKEGKILELLVTTVPYAAKDGTFDLVMEMAVDITHTMELQEELKMTNSTMRSLISSSLYGIISVDEKGDIILFNQAAKRMFNTEDQYQLRKEDLDTIFPKGFLEQVSASSGPVYLHETRVNSPDGTSFPARLTGTNLLANDQHRGKAFWIHDIRRIKKLETENLEAERLAAVGKTVAGLAHGIKNVLTGLEGGEYLLNSGLQKADAARVQKGMEMLHRNTLRVSTFVKEFLNFSKGQEIETTLCDPVEIARDVVNTYSIKVDQLGIELVTEFPEGLEPASLDGEGIHECLSNLLGNAIDACRISEGAGNLRIILRIFEKNGTLVYEVVDNGCGMDYEVKRKVFTTFFTTKGLGGTGLGLLMTKKVIQQHGGTVEFDSIVDQGTSFRISLPRDRLPDLGKTELAG
ncbi:MAG: PAS domain S-box protein [Proteobacteria bacterium]|nr:PAS domain S-box protein [Pseudomonadota bacterium]